MRPDRRSGYTLVEVVLVVAVMALLAALLVPTMRGTSGPYKLNGAIDSVRSAWAHARARAMEEGRPYRFAIVPETGLFRVAPDAPEFWSGGAAPTEKLPGQERPPLVLEQALPAGVVFALADSGTAIEPPDANTVADDRKPKSPASPESYVSPIVFDIDGSAREDAELLFQVRGAAPKILCLRGMTGVVTVKPANLPNATSANTRNPSR